MELSRQQQAKKDGEKTKRRSGSSPHTDAGHSLFLSGGAPNPGNRIRCFVHAGILNLRILKTAFATEGLLLQSAFALLTLSAVFRLVCLRSQNIHGHLHPAVTRCHRVSERV